ncbi:IclR family transcriptional regulator [Streptomyces lusitanus]|uniref:IclR family transcriptional regulator C-terminal domain-containing protein n=1 Tax=Streptomyces lusitanus TaxID=68232 RepID=A0ABU3JLP5_9ACTN|nr:IclR family transcriptional regulator C-terminal domain-containing protein [Streptomyces lusitanus]
MRHGAIHQSGVTRTPFPTPQQNKFKNQPKNTSHTAGSSHAERVFRVQHAFTQLGGEVHGLAELARASSLDDSTVYRILRSGIEQGAFVQVARGRYRLGPAAARLGTQALTPRLDHDALGDCLEQLRLSADGGMVFLYGLTNLGHPQRHCIDMAVGAHDLTELGMSPREIMRVNRSLRIGASGRAILAHLSENLQHRVLAEQLPATVGPGVYRDRGQLLVSLAEIRVKGYALGFQECARGWDSFASPVLWDGTVLGSLVLLKPAHQSAATRDRCVLAVRSATAEVSQLIGVLEPQPRGRIA